MKETYDSILAIRRDLQPNLIHFTKQKGKDTAFDILKKIVKEKKLVGSSHLVKGNHKCISFSEAPLAEHISYFNIAKINPQIKTRYEPCGILFKKKFLFDKSARHVIYQPSEEYENLSKEMQYRHVTYDCDKIDFTWEREWRIQAEELVFTLKDIHILVPDEDHVHDLFAEFAEFAEVVSGFDVSFDGEEAVYDGFNLPRYDLKVVSLDVYGLK